MKTAIIGTIGVALLAFSTFAHADETPQLRYADRKWSTLTLAIPANQSALIRVTNDSTEAIEFESFKLNREKTVAPGETITVRVPALGAGEYDFYDDFHQDVPQGTIVAK